MVEKSIEIKNFQTDPGKVDKSDWFSDFLRRGAAFLKTQG